ncbi:MAG TPA: DUF819 family protein [Bacteroidetes bacterium]|nr:DUF819 family protein [Bacteroidota bacterium]
MPTQLFQTVAILVLPYLLSHFTKWLKTEKLLSPVVLSYVAGILLTNLSPWPLDNKISGVASQLTIILAIPLLLYSTDLIGWFKLAKTTIISFFLVIVSVITGAFMVAPLFAGRLENTWLLTGMLTGVFIGGTPNMSAVGVAMEADESVFVILNATELICGGIYLIFLTSVAHRFYGFFLKDFDKEGSAADEFYEEKKHFVWKEVLLAIGLTLLLAAVSLGLNLLLTGDLKHAGLIILFISALAVGASFSPKIRNLRGAYEVGEYLLLMFCVAIGMMANLSDLLNSGGWLFLFTGCSWLVALTLHLLLCKLFDIDRDTMMITQTAGFYGPPFIGQIAAVMKNRSLVFSGIATGLVGLAIANFIGVAVAKLLKVWLM